jgi:phosphatidylglycerol:prolipoprotein diacylglycerol transferase
MVFPAVPLCADGTRIHPWPIYESLADLTIFGLLLFLFGRRRFKGQVFLIYLILYAAARGSLEFLRGDLVRGVYFGGTLSLSQIVAIVVLIGAAALYIYRRRYLEGGRTK